MRRGAAGVLLVLVLACDSAPPGPAPSAGPTASSAPQLPAAEPTSPSVAVFAAEALAVCRSAMSAVATAPLRGDPLAAAARRRDVRAAVDHYRTASRSWTQAAGALFTFGLPPGRAGQRMVSAFDVLALRSQQLAESLAAGDTAAAQAAVAAVDTALAEADEAARALGLGPLSACEGDGAAATRARGRRLPVTADDFAFSVAAAVPGRTRVVLTNAGREDHHLFVVRLREPGTLGAAIAADRRGEPPGPFLAAAGDVSPVAQPGERVVLDVVLRPGSYGFICFVASQDGTPHAYKGMATEVAVTR